MDETRQAAWQAAMNGDGGARKVTGISQTVRFYPNAFGKGLIALAISFAASGYAAKKFLDAANEAFKERS